MRLQPWTDCAGDQQGPILFKCFQRTPQVSAAEPFNVICGSPSHLSVHLPPLQKNKQNRTAGREEEGETMKKRFEGDGGREGAREEVQIRGVRALA